MCCKFVSVIKIKVIKVWGFWGLTLLASVRFSPRCLTRDPWVALNER